MNSMNVFSLKVFGSPAFSAGGLFMYEQVDSLIDISRLIEDSGIKVKGVPLARLVKAIVTGILNGKKSVSQIYSDIKANGAARYIGKELDKASLRNLFRAIEKLGGEKGKALYESIVDTFKERFGIDFSQANVDFTASFFEGDKCKMAKRGHSKDHRPDRPQIKLGLVQCGKQLIPFHYDTGEGNVHDVQQFSIIFDSVKEKLSEGSLVVFDKGPNSKENRELIASAGHYYLTSEKMTKKLKSEILAVKRHKMQKVNDDVKCLMEKTSEGWRYYYYDKKLAKQTRQRRTRKIAKQIRAAEELRKKMQGKAFRKRNVKKKLKITELTEEQIVTEISVQKRYTTKPLKQIKKEMKAAGKEFDGWFVLCTNKWYSPKGALKRYRKKDCVEKMFCSLKQNCKLRPFNVRKDECVKGSVFLSHLTALILGCFQWNNKQLRHKSHTSIIELVKRLTLTLKLDKKGNIIEAIVLNATKFLAKLFPQLQT